MYSHLGNEKPSASRKIKLVKPGPSPNWLQFWAYESTRFRSMSHSANLHFRKCVNRPKTKTRTTQFYYLLPRLKSK